MELRVVRVTDRFDEACRFYGELLGWPVTKAWDADEGQGQGRIFGFGDSARVELIEGTPEPVSGLMLAAEVADVAAVASTLTGAGIELVAPLADQPWGHRNLAVLDPTGVRLVLFQVL